MIIIIILALLLYQNAWSGKGWGGRRPRVLSQPNYSGAGCHISLNSHMDILPFYLLLRDTLQSWSNLFNNIRCSFPLPKIKRARPAECAQKENYCPINLNCDKCYTCDWKPGNTHNFYLVFDYLTTPRNYQLKMAVHADHKAEVRSANNH